VLEFAALAFFDPTSIHSPAYDSGRNTLTTAALPTPAAPEPPHTARLLVQGQDRVPSVTYS
jgi:hypothetical protein